MQAVVHRDVLTGWQLIESGEFIDGPVHARHARGVRSRPRRRFRYADVALAADVSHATTVPVDALPLG